jgi:GT2 family glycosyltransferase
MALPFVSVIIVNYNGAKFLPTCLEALSKQTYPRGCFEVVLSDNASQDESIKLLKRQFPWVRILENDDNLGFASGNNVAVQSTIGKYVVLLNNDTSVSPVWLENIVEVAEQNPRAGLITGHLQLFYNQLEIEIFSDTFSPEGDSRQLGVQVFEVDSGATGGVVQYLDGFYGWETHPSGRRFRWAQSNAIFGVPVPGNTGEWVLNLTLAATRPDDVRVPCRLSVSGYDLGSIEVSGSEPKNYCIPITDTSQIQTAPLVQNAGSIIFKNGSSRDRGTYVRNSEVFYELDSRQYDRIEEVFSGCGASLLMRREMIDEVGLLDDDFFMYYEDTDLAWRARLQGWQVLYAPTAIVRHIHCGTTEEWSPFFYYHAERNRLAMVFKNGEICQILLVWGKYLGRIFLDTWITVKAILRRDSNWRAVASNLRVRIQVMISLLGWLPDLWRKRHKIQSRRKVSPASLRVWFVEQN